MHNWLDDLKGWLGTDAYSTAWVARVPDAHDPTKPAWPEALEYLRSHQHEDGGWGESQIYYAHERTICTLAAVLALHTWQAKPEDNDRIRRGLAALTHYAADLPSETHEPIGFELLLPRMRDEMMPVFGASLPLDRWASIDTIHAEKLASIRQLHPVSTLPQTWWFSLEMLPEQQLIQLDDSLLDANGSVATSTAATAAYLLARRRAGTDSPRAAEYLKEVMAMGHGGVSVGWPFEVYERVWALDSFMRAGIDPGTAFVQRLARAVRASWDLHEPGLSYSNMFQISDGDNTLVGFTVLNWAGLPPSERALHHFWDEDHFRTYKDERGASISVNIHGLMALRSRSGSPYREMAGRVAHWLISHMSDSPAFFEDKWHISPYYSVAHAIPAFAGWDTDVALRCVNALLEQQCPDGGWGWFKHQTMEETAHCALGLCYAFRYGLLQDNSALERAAHFFRSNSTTTPQERLWIGKTLYQPAGIIKATLFAAKTALQQLGFADVLEGAETKAA